MAPTHSDIRASLPPARRARIEAPTAELVAEVEGLAALRKLAERSQAEMARELNIKQPSVHKIEKQTDDGKWKFVVNEESTVGVKVEESELRLITGSIPFEIHDEAGALFNGNLTVTADAFTPDAPAVFNLLDWSGLSSSPTFASRFTFTGYLTGNGDEASGLDLPDISGSGYFWDINGFKTNGTIAIVMIVPEPSRLLLLGLTLGAMLVKRRR